jgi:zinc/manganese transport system permease protein
MSDFIHIMGLPLLVSLILTGIHTYLGLHVLERQIIFIDLALAQIAALGGSMAIVWGFKLDSSQAYWLSLGLTIVGAAIFSLTHGGRRKVPQEAIIGIVYVVTSAMMVIVLSRSGEGDEHIRHVLAGNILLVTKQEVMIVAIIYGIIGGIHYVFRRQFLLISCHPEEARQQGLNIRFWNFIFYVTFGIVVTSSTRIVGVMLVFALLVTPASCAVLLSERLRIRLALGWGFGVLGSLLGMMLSWHFDWPTSASIVCVLGVFLFSLLIFGRNE